MIEEKFHELLAGEELGMSFVAFQDGKELVSLHGGWADRHESKPWNADTLIPVWSATKGPMAVCVLIALHRAGMNTESLVRRVWPELKVGELTFGELFSHQGGLAALDDRVSIWNYDAVIAALENQEPQWEVGTPGYHPRTIGFIADEMIRRLDGRSLSVFWHEEIAKPQDLDFWIGLPESEHHRVAELVPARAGKAGEPKVFYEALLQKDSLTRRAFSSPAEFTGVSEMNQARAWAVGWPAMGGVASAHGVAKFYDWLLRQSFLAELIELRVSGLDKIQRIPAQYGFGMKLESAGLFGHPGAGGSYGLADPQKKLSYGFVMNRFEANLFPSAARRALVSQII